MPDAKAGSFASIDGNEIVNSSRTISYIHNFGLPITVDDDCWCSDLPLLLNCPTPTGITPGYNYPSNNPLVDPTPVSDPAPWYDPAIPESGDFLGFLPTEFEGLNFNSTRSVFDNLTGGALLGRLRPGSRLFTWRGFLFGRTCCAAEYGLRWLTSVLLFAGGCEGCDGSELDILVCCPEVTGGPVPPNTSCGPTQAPALGIMQSKDAFRRFRNTGLADGPRRLSERQLGCGGCEDQEPGCIIEVEFSIIAGSPWAYRETQEVCSDPFPTCGICPGEAEIGFWQKMTTLTKYPADKTEAKACTALLECLADAADCVVDPDCPIPALPEIPGFQDDCGCEAYNFARICCEVSNDIYGQFFEGVPTIEVYSGTLPLHNVRIDFYENPQERPCTDPAVFDICNRCASINVRFIPADSTLVIDGLSQQINMICPGDNTQAADSLVTSPFDWPVFSCKNFIVTINADCNYPIDTTNSLATLKVTPREP